ncbi:rab GTPase-binding effector protein 1 [Chrysoperla carnea]|uniref:rab GTPase-binding effector protein 1 n=1 Tax=Chrysoperla carnea TaxID=189513 RepID=UPI001D06BED0|nr:rab GTPase-binding effector protein 1 [Chrysoperla carnea]
MENNIQENEVDYTQKINMLTEQIHQLENEKKTISEEFNVQRAKMKELFLQKEAELKQNAAEKLALREEVKKIQTELNETRSQLCVADLRLESDLEVEKRKAQEEIATLQQLFQETMEESTCSRSMYDTELKKLKLFTQQLQTENSELRSLMQQNSPHHTSSESTSLAPSIMLSAVTKTLARKLGADAHSNQENLEESMRRAQEDAEVLRSLVVPLEEEIHALKDKLRSTDEQLQQCRLCGHNADNKSIGRTGSSTETSPIKDAKSTSNKLVDISNAEATSPSVNSTLTTQLNTSTSSQNYEDDDKKSSSPIPTCDMCNNYETQLVQEQQNVNELRKKLVAAEKILERQKEDLTKEISFRKDMEEKWNEKKEEHKEKVAELNKKTLCAEQDLQELRQTFEQTQMEITEQLTRLTKEREQVREHLNKVQQENDNLIGKHSIHSQQLQSEMINLPSDVDELQLVLLKSHEDLITASVAKEVALEQQESLRCEIQLMRDQMIIEQQTRQELENTLVAENDSLKQELHRITKDSASTLELQRNLVEALRIKKILEEHNSELKSRVSALQQELDNSEQVQKDFVRLSQSLQVELEKIRASDTQVRWQYEEDIEECPGCRNPFVGQRKKIHCRHCGQIFCINCLSHTVLSGPNRRPSKVCGVCHTLLNRNTAPYFSTEAPHLPD